VDQVREDVRCLFVDHGLEHSSLLRGAAAKVAATLGLELVALDGPVEDGSDLEARARTARREALLGAVAEEELLVLGHTADDQAETVLLNLFRGAGAGGLSGMGPVRLPWVRPLLSFSRSDMRRLAEHVALPFADDPSNLDRRHARNRVRLDLIPMLERDFNPAVKSIVAATAQRLSVDEEALAAAADEVTIQRSWGAVLLPTAPLVTLPEAVAVRAVRRGMRILFDPYPGTSRDVGLVMEVARSGGRAQLSGGLTVVAEGPYAAVHHGLPEPPPPAPLPLGETLAWGEWSLHAHRTRRQTAPRAGSTYLDPTALGDSMTVRPWSAGDRIDIAAGTKPVAEVLREAGVAPRLRPVWPVVWVGAKIAAVAGLRPASWTAPTGRDTIELTMGKGAA
jgi:tRNA(Ile)-lysidine synthase